MVEKHKKVLIFYGVTVAAIVVLCPFIWLSDADLWTTKILFTGLVVINAANWANLYHYYRKRKKNQIE